jgi:hypothetical protein
MIFQVSKSMYRLIQSPKLWYNELTEFLCDHGFKTCKADECILYRNRKGKHVLLILYVDDILILSCDKAMCHWVKDILTDKYEKVTFNEGDKLCYLGMTLKNEVLH